MYEPNSFVPLLQTGYTSFIKLIEAPDYRQFKDVPYSIYKDPVWNTEKRKNKAELERVAFYHCDQVGTPQTLSNERGECVWEMTQNTWGTTHEIKTSDNLFEQTNLRFQGQYYDSKTGLHYNRYRYYEPYSARYVSKDPIGLFGGLNTSAYVSDPNQWVDPLGLQNKKSDYDKAMAPFYKVLERKVVADANELNSLVSKKKSIDERARKSLAPQNIKNNKLVVKDRELGQINKVSTCTANQTCSIDYISFGGGLGPWSMSASVNTYNGDIFFSPINISPTSAGPTILGVAGSVKDGVNKPIQILVNSVNMTTKLTPLGFLGNWGSAGLMFGQLHNVDGDSRSDATSGFLNGEAYTCSSTPYKKFPATAAVTVSGSDFNKDPTTIFNKVYATEAGFNINGGILDCNRSNSHKVK